MESRFDALAKALAGSGSRRDAIRRVAGVASAAVLASLGFGCESETATGPGSVNRFVPVFDRGRCKKVGQKCRQNDECCSDFCDPFTGYCTCPSGTQVCSASGQCVPACAPPFVLNSNTCQCECPANSFACGGVTCCVTGTDCCNGTCVNFQTNAQHCGSCNNVCQTGATCVAGQCVCPATAPTTCNGQCVNTLTDATNCGSCNNSCAFNQICVNGACVCPGVTCGGNCCAPGQSCFNFAGILICA
jgi:Stigma-specific protein, Stig1/CXCXC repeat